MKKSVFFPLALMAIFILVVGSACNLPFLSGSDETNEPEVVVVTATSESVIAAPNDEPTEEPVVEMTEEPATGEAQAYYREEFDGNLDNFTYDVIYFTDGGQYEDAEVYNENGALRFENNGEYLFTYVYYDPYIYTDVRIDMEAENLATNDNSVTLACRYDPERGWYEYNIDNDGEWTLYYYDMVIAKDYVQLYDGGSTAIKMGRDTNTYTMICQGTELSLYINGVFTKTYEHKDLKEGQVAFGVSSYDSYPVKVNVNWLEISEP